MALQVSAGYGSLIALGVSIGDIATFVSLSKRVGNWMTAASGDKDFLELLDVDEFILLQRRGLIDEKRFNKLWGSEIAFLAQGEAKIHKGEIAEKALEKLGRFTAFMVCTIAALDAFATVDVVKLTLRNVLSELLRTTEYGEDILSSQYTNRVNSWRSTATVRGLSNEARKIRKDLLARGVVVDGLIPRGDAPHVVSFLIWLLITNSETHVTASSDVAGIGVCLSRLGIEILSVEGLGEIPLETPCRLRYVPDAPIKAPNGQLGPDAEILTRIPSTSINLFSPSESMTKFPIDMDTANRCRSAWKQGTRAADFISCRPLVPRSVQSPKSYEDLKFIFYDMGTKPDRVQPEIHQLAMAHSFAANEEMCNALGLALEGQSLATLTWMLEQTVKSSVDTQIWDPEMLNGTRIDAFTVFQAFFMGYYYGIFLRMVDTSSLRLQIVDGAWGYLSREFLCNMRTLLLDPNKAKGHGIKVLRREDVLGILSALLLAAPKVISQTNSPSFKLNNWCLGVIEKRALLVRSLVRPCRTTREIGNFVLIDVDVSGVPVNVEGLVRPGVPDQRALEINPNYPELSQWWLMYNNYHDGNSTEDATFHIEADWDGDPESTLLCLRYRGRRVTTINPATADINFLQALTRPSGLTKPMDLPLRIPIEKCLRWTVSDLLNGKLPPQKGTDEPLKPIILSLAGRPRLRYFATEFFSLRTTVRMATDNIKVALCDAWDVADKRRSTSLFIIEGTEANWIPKVDDWVPEEIENQMSKFES